MTRGIITFSLIICSLLSAGCAGNIPVAPLVTRPDASTLQTSDLQTASIPAENAATPSPERFTSPQTVNQYQEPNIVSETPTAPARVRPEPPPPQTMTKPDRKLNALKKYIKKRKF